MKKIVLGSLLLVWANNYAQEDFWGSRQSTESIEMFAARFKPANSKIEYSVFETKSLDSLKNTIVAFYRETIYEKLQMESYEDHSEHDEITGYVYIPTTENNYQRIKIGEILASGGDPEIVSVFFANADKDDDLELIVLSKSNQRHYDYSGTMYETYIFDYMNNEFKYLEVLSNIFYGCECGGRNLKFEKAKFKTENDIRKKLNKLGF